MEPEVEHAISLRIASRRERLTLLRAAIRGLAEEAQLPSSVAGQLELCVTEAVSNCIEHAYGNESVHEIVIGWTETPGEITVAIYDRGKTMKATELARALSSPLEVDPLDPESFRPRGRGLLLIQELATQVAYASEGGFNKLAMRFSTTVER